MGEIMNTKVFFISFMVMTSLSSVSIAMKGKFLSIYGQQLQELRNEVEKKLMEYKQNPNRKIMTRVNLTMDYYKQVETFHKKLRNQTVNSLLKNPELASQYLANEQLPYVLIALSYSPKKNLFRKIIDNIITKKIIKPIKRKSYRGDLCKTICLAAEYGLYTIIKTINEAEIYTVTKLHQDRITEYLEGDSSLYMVLAKDNRHKVLIHDLCTAFQKAVHKKFFKTTQQLLFLLLQIISQQQKYLCKYCNFNEITFREHLQQALDTARNNDDTKIINLLYSITPENYFDRKLPRLVDIHRRINFPPRLFDRRTLRRCSSYRPSNYLIRKIPPFQLRKIKTLEKSLKPLISCNL
jgi:hypothetical protein